MSLEYITLKIRMSGNVYYPYISVIRDGITNEYRPHGEHDMKRLQLLLDTHPGKIHVDMENSTVEICHIRRTIR